MHGTLKDHPVSGATPAAAWQPYVYRKGVMWGDTDSAAIAYTGRFTYWTLEAIEMFLRERIGCDWYTINRERDLGTPFVNVSINFRAPVTPRESLLIEVVVSRVGASAVTCRLAGRGESSNVLCFDATATFVFAENATLAKIPIPADFVDRLRDEHAQARLLSGKPGAAA
ncbi:MAG: acyl-CoA thioesterase [Xanthobacteraceae bacterium]|nr:MAG: acyl-CoA thioesterase [Xanthobacteraceae bacterium]